MAYRIFLHREITRGSQRISFGRHLATIPQAETAQSRIVSQYVSDGWTVERNEGIRHAGNMQTWLTDGSRKISIGIEES